MLRLRKKGAGAAFSGSGIAFFLERGEQFFFRERRFMAQNAMAAGYVPDRFRQRPKFGPIRIAAVVYVFADRIAQKQRLFLRDEDANAVVGVRRFGEKHLCRDPAEVICSSERKRTAGKATCGASSAYSPAKNRSFRRRRSTLAGQAKRWRALSRYRAVFSHATVSPAAAHMPSV